MKIIPLIGLVLSLNAFTQTVSSPKKKQEEIRDYKLFGEAYARTAHKVSPPVLPDAKIIEELANYGMKITSTKGKFQDLVNSVDPANLKATFDKYDGYILQPTQGNMLPSDFAPILSLDIQERCYTETSVVTTRNSGFTSVELLRGKSIITLESALTINLVVNSKVKFKEVLIATDARDMLEALKKGRASAFVDIVAKYPNMIASKRIGKYQHGRSSLDPALQIIYTTNDQIPCYFLASNLKKFPDMEERLLKFAKDRPVESKSVFNSIGGFTTIHSISGDWKRMEALMRNNDAFEKYFKGELKDIPFKRYK